MKQTSGKLTLVYGSKCHPDMDQLASNWDAKILEPSYCIGLLTGPQREAFAVERIARYWPPTATPSPVLAPQVIIIGGTAYTKDPKNYCRLIA